MRTCGGVGRQARVDGALDRPGAAPQDSGRPVLYCCVPRDCGGRPASAPVRGNGRRIRVTQVGEIGDVAAGRCIDEQCHVLW